MWIFSTREIAIIFYAILFIVYILLHKKTRIAFGNVINAACKVKLIIPFFFVLIYSSIFVYLCTKFTFWKWQYFKDIVIWTFFVGVPICFNAASHQLENNYFKNIVIDNLKFTALVQFFSGTFTFNIVIELLLQPILVFFVLLQFAAKDKDIPVKKFADGIVGFTVLLILFFTIKSAINAVGTIELIDICISFTLPIILSILYLPISYLFAVFAKYEILFLRMSFKEPQNRIIKLKHRIKVVMACKLSYGKIRRFLYSYVPQMYTTMDNSNFDEIINTFKTDKTS